MRLLSPFCLIAVLALSSQAFAQRAPAIPGVTGTFVTPETAKDEKKAEDKAAAAIGEALPKGKDRLPDLAAGSTVVIHHQAEVTEGVVSRITRSEGAITVRYRNGKTEKLQLTTNAADAIAVDYPDRTTGRKVTRYFKAKS